MVTISQKKTYNRNLVSLQAFFSDDTEIKQIIRICDLHPQGWREWHSSFGHYLKIVRKKLVIKNGIVTIPTDIYRYTHPSTLIYSSKIIAYLEDHLALWGDDEKLRVFEYHSDINGHWKRACCLQLSLNAIRNLVRFERKNLTYDMSRTYGQVVCQLPPTSESFKFLQTANKELCQNRLQTLIEAF